MAGQTFKANDFSRLVLAITAFHNQMDIALQHPDQHMEEIGSLSHSHHAVSPFLGDHVVAGRVDAMDVILTVILLYQRHQRHAPIHLHNHHCLPPIHFTLRIMWIVIHRQCRPDQNRETVPGLRSWATGVRSDVSKAQLSIWSHSAWFGTLGHTALWRDWH